MSAAKHLRGRRISVTITIDDGEPIHRRVRTVLVGNVGKLQGGLLLLPDAQPDDGVLDVVVIAPRNAARLGPGHRPGAAAGRRARPADGTVHRAARLIECSHSQPRQLDGDLIESSRTMDIRIEPGALLVQVA